MALAPWQQNRQRYTFRGRSVVLSGQVRTVNGRGFPYTMYRFAEAEGLGGSVPAGQFNTEAICEGTGRKRGRCACDGCRLSLVKPNDMPAPVSKI